MFFVVLSILIILPFLKREFDVFSKNIELMLFCFGIIHKIGGMKRLFSMILGSILLAALHPVEGSDNYLETDDPSGGACAEVQFVFARGSGATRNDSGEWLAFRDAMSAFAARRQYSFAVTDLDYPAVSVMNPVTNALGAYVSAGQYYKFGQSV